MIIRFITTFLSRKSASKNESCSSYEQQDAFNLLLLLRLYSLSGILVQLEPFNNFCLKAQSLDLVETFQQGIIKMVIPPYIVL